jgi:hypothetical protein
MPKYLETAPHPWTLEDIKKAMSQDFRHVHLSIDQTEGGKIWNNLKELDDTIWIFSTSAAELIDEICVFGERSKATDFWDKTNEKNSELYVREVKRRLYYCTSAVMTLVDIARNFSRRCHVDGLQDKRNEIFSTPGLHEFLQNLRNFSTHWRIAQANWQINFDRQSGVRTAHFIIAKEELLAWDGWVVKAREYIQQSGDSIDLLKVFTQYKKHVQQYYNWHKGAVLDQHASSLQRFFEYKRMHEGLLQYMKWNMILSHAPSDLNPYQYLAQHLTDSQIEIVLSHQHRSEQQVDALIKLIDLHEICDENLKSKLMKVFSAKQAE